MAKKNEALKTIVVAGVLCIVCSIIVSAIVVTLRPKQKKNAEIDYKKNILLSAGLMEKGADVEEAFKKVETVLVSFETGKIVKPNQVDAIENLKTYDQNKASTDPDRSNIF